MKLFSKIIAIGAIILLVVACTKGNIKKEEYIHLVDKLEQSDKFLTTFPFNIEVKLTRILDDEVSYKVIIDKKDNNLKQIKAIAIHNMKTTDIYPSIGIFDKPIDLLVNQDKKGIILVGYIKTKKDIKDLELEIKVYVEFINDEGKLIKNMYKYQNMTK
ncbi:MAG: hypothetical protein RR359_02070 [Bacilli bacterium]